MLADTAIAVHPDDDRYTRLVGETAILPIVGRRLRIIADPYVKPEFGTGALKITPGHDPNDFEIGRKHGLEEISAIGEDGRMTEAAGERFAGMTALEAREAVVAALREEGRIARTEPYVHNVPYSHRSGERIEPLISLQWFMRMDELAARRDRARARRARPDQARGPARGATSSGWRTSGPGASRASCGGATRSPSTTAATRPTWASSRRRARAGSATPTCSTRGSRASCGRSRRSAGRRTRPSCAPSTRPTCSRRRATSCSCGWPGW